ncbi:unnamed protein product [Effrenium voratum]|uniref:Calcineurin-like phosphoesterase domain-containing protein n=1 Tax=Effrenium voratum TaxID=2562239 RepID=A0AA36ISI2_9DINO|nr:unnamed protein product [Effrenium voratum]
MEDLGHVPLPNNASAGGGVRVLQLTDVHRFPAGCRYWDCPKGRRVEMEPGYSTSGDVAILEAALSNAAVHFVVLTGDILDGRPFGALGDRSAWRPALEQLLAPIQRAGLPWTFVPGNHDDDESPWSREDLLKIYDLPGCASKGAMSFNHTMTIGFGAEADEDALRLWFFDSGGNSPDPEIRYGTFGADCVRGFEDLAARLPPKTPGLAFFHIPLPEYGGLTPLHGTQGLFDSALRAGMVPRPWCWVPSLVRALGFHRAVGCSKLNSGIFDAFVRSGQIKATFCGHDHACDAIFQRAGIFLCYGRVTSTTPPSDWEGDAPLPFAPGARVVAFEQGRLATWVETLAGEEPKTRFLLD